MKLSEKPFKIEELFDKDFEGFSNTIKDENFRKLASEFNKKYLYWSELKYRIEDQTKREYA